MSHGELVASPGITGPSTGIRKRNLKIITDTLPSFTDQQSSESARENMSRLDPFADPCYLYDGASVISGANTPYIFTPARVLISNDMRFRFFPPDQTVVSSKPGNPAGQDAATGTAHIATKSIPFIAEEPLETVLMPDVFPGYGLAQPSPDPSPAPASKRLYQETTNIHEQPLPVSKESPRQGASVVQTRPIECKKPSIPIVDNICRYDFKRMVRALSKTERDALMQLLSQEVDSEDKATDDTRPDRTTKIQTNNNPNTVNDTSAQNTGNTPDQMESLANADISGGASQTPEHQRRQNYTHPKHDSSFSSEPAPFSTLPSFYSPHSHNIRRTSMQTTGGNYAVHDSPIIVNTNTNYTVPNVPKIYINESTSHFAHHSNVQCKFAGMGYASSTFDRRRPRPTFRATIYEDSPKASKAFTVHDDNIILASITYYVGDYNTTDLNWHIIYYYYSLLIYNNRTLSSLRSRFHKYLKMDFKFDIKDYSLSYWLNTLELCASVMHHTNVPITKRGELCNMIAANGNKVHYLLTCIFIFLRPDMQYNELKHNFCIWLELINGPHSFL